jgi:hypothetical protein
MATFLKGRLKTMKRKLVVIGLALAMFFSFGYKNQAEAHTTVSFNLFFNTLAPYGNWISTPDYGYVWSPSGYGQDWRPYSDGHWVWTDYGWTWVSYEPWGWAPYDYGRWVFTDYYGWVWIPGTAWAPAWVTWYTGPSYIGWAPLAPDNNFFLQIGIGPAAFGYYTRPSYCVFVPAASFLSVNINSVVIPPSRNVTIINNTTNINNITVVNNRVINRGPDVNFVERVGRVKVQKVNVVERNVDQRAVVKGGANVNRLEGNKFYVYRPDVVKKVNETPVTERGFGKDTVKTRNGNEAIQNQANYQNTTNQVSPGFKQNNERNTGDINNRNEVINQNNKRNKNIQNKGNFQNSSNQGFNQDTEQNKKNRNGNEATYQNETKSNKGFQDQNKKDSHNQQYPINWNDKVDKPFVSENTTQFQNPNEQAGNRYRTYKNTEGQFSNSQTGRSAGNFKQVQEANNDSYPRANQWSYYNNNPGLDAKGQGFNQRDFRQPNGNNRNSDSHPNRKQTLPYQSN